jgi:hypothetical protein
MGVQLVIEDFEGAKTVVALDGEVTIGRQEGSTIQLTEKNVSRRHARLRPVDDGWQLEDLQSYNGVRLNGELIEGASLIHEGDLIQIGDYQITLGEGAGALKSTMDLGPGTLAAANDPAEAAVAPPDVNSGPAEPAVGPAAAVAFAAPGTGSYDEVGLDDPPKKSKAGLVIGGLLLVGIGVGVFFTQQGKAANDSAASAASTTTAAAATKPEGTDAPEDESPPDSEAAEATVEDPVEDSPEAAVGESADAVDTAAEDPGAEDVDADPLDDEEAADAAVEDSGDLGDADETPAAPAAKKKKKKKQKKKSASALLADARKAQLAGRYSSAYSLANRAYGTKASQEAAQVMGVAACKMGDASKAKKALSKLSGGKKSALKSVCAGAGINL